MRAPRLSFSEEFRDVWDKENKDPDTLEFSSKTITGSCEKKEGEKKSTSSKVDMAPKVELLWLNELLGCIL
ncbi:hypothetical protein NEIRO03_1191 [Nematocida sp. AWRm78]|nr:hypothetical protein NEIRO02_1263 [Nematocida sp. AWRm79]KAI5183611.1 hypothetical protein NEIRO03_1191 [Nematocida sp. AWRm78]